MMFDPNMYVVATCDNRGYTLPSRNLKCTLVWTPIFCMQLLLFSECWAHPIHAADSRGTEHERLPLLDETKQTQGQLAQKKGQLDRFPKNWCFSALPFFEKRERALCSG